MLKIVESISLPWLQTTCNGFCVSFAVQRQICRPSVLNTNFILHDDILIYLNYALVGAVANTSAHCKSRQ